MIPNSSAIISIFAILIISVLLIITGLKKQPGLGILGAVLIIILLLWARGDSLLHIGFSPPQNWFSTIIMGFGLGIIIQLLSVILIEPLSEKITHTPHDHSLINAVRGNWKVFLQWMILVWVLVALIEEGIFRGYLMTDLKNLLGVGMAALTINLLVTSFLFGLSHAYQGPSGMVSTGFVGAILGVIFIFSDFNLWLAIFTHGFIDTVGIGLIAMGIDKKLKIQF